MEVLYCTQCCKVQQLIKSVVAYINKKKYHPRLFRFKMIKRTSRLLLTLSVFPLADQHE